MTPTTATNQAAVTITHPWSAANQRVPREQQTLTFINQSTLPCEVRFASTATFGLSSLTLDGGQQRTLTILKREKVDLYILDAQPQKPSPLLEHKGPRPPTSAPVTIDVD